MICRPISPLGLVQSSPVQSNPFIFCLFILLIELCKAQYFYIIVIISLDVLTVEIKSRVSLFSLFKARKASLAL